MNIENNILYLGLDYLVIYGRFLFEEEYFDKLNFENSASSQFQEFGILKVEIPRHEYKIIFSYNNSVVFAYEKGEGEAQGGVKSYDKVIIYGTGFKLVPNDRILSFLQENFELTHNQRIDICADVNIDIEVLLQHINVTILQDRDQIVRQGKIATQYLGNRNKYSNKRYLIRIYNKIHDILSKNKLWLYKEYFPEKFVTRMEVEIRPEYAKNVSWESLFDNRILEGLFLNYFSKFTDLFNFIKEKPISLLHPYNIDESNFQSFSYSEERKLRLKINNFIGRARNLQEIGFDVISILIFEDIKSPIIERAIGKDLVQKIINEQAKQKNIANRRHYKRKISSHRGVYE